MKIALIGHGAMGTLLESLVEKRGHEMAVVIDQDYANFDARELAAEIRGAEVAIDFSSAEAVTRNIEACMLAEVPLVEGTTGWNSELDTVRQTVEDSGGAMVYGANFSIGVNLFYRITDFAAELFARFPEYEAFIEEQHHSRKKDAPSGTALRLKELVSKHIKTEFSVSSTRAGNIPGTHRAGFDGPADQALLEHTARSREGFAAGAITAAEWIVGKKGLFEFSDVMDEICQNSPP
jgi:4-hydroxy-tetrahydrodipicolinate reductase